MAPNHTAGQTTADCNRVVCRAATAAGLDISDLHLGITALPSSPRPLRTTNRSWGPHIGNPAQLSQQGLPMRQCLRTTVYVLIIVPIQRTCQSLIAFDFDTPADNSQNGSTASLRIKLGRLIFRIVRIHCKKRTPPQGILSGPPIVLWNNPLPTSSSATPSIQ